MHAFLSLLLAGALGALLAAGFAGVLRELLRRDLRLGRSPAPRHAPKGNRYGIAAAAPPRAAPRRR